MTLDTTTLTLIQQIQTPFLTLISKTISTITDPIVLTITAIIISIILYTKKQKKQSIIIFLTTISTAIIIEILKQIIKRPRPLIYSLPSTIYHLPSNYSFPSGHTTMAVVFFGLITYLFAKKQKTLSIILATLIVIFVSFSRIYLQAHWLTDVIVGAILGSIILTTSIIIHKSLS